MKRSVETEIDGEHFLLTFDDKDSELPVDKFRVEASYFICVGGNIINAFLTGQDELLKMLLSAQN